MMALRSRVLSRTGRTIQGNLPPIAIGWHTHRRWPHHQRQHRYHQVEAGQTSPCFEHYFSDALNCHDRQVPSTPLLGTTGTGTREDMNGVYEIVRIIGPLKDPLTGIAAYGDDIFIGTQQGALAVYKRGGGHERRETSAPGVLGRAAGADRARRGAHPVE